MFVNIHNQIFSALALVFIFSYFTVDLPGGWLLILQAYSFIAAYFVCTAIATSVWAILVCYQ